VSESRAKGARSVGFIWILAGSALLGALVVAIVWAAFSGPLAHKHGETQVTSPAAVSQIRKTTPPTPGT